MASFCVAAPLTATVDAADGLLALSSVLLRPALVPVLLLQKEHSTHTHAWQCRSARSDRHLGLQLGGMF